MNIIASSLPQCVAEENLQKLIAGEVFIIDPSDEEAAKAIEENSVTLTTETKNTNA